MMVIKLNSKWEINFISLQMLSTGKDKLTVQPNKEPTGILE